MSSVAGAIWILLIDDRQTGQPVASGDPAGAFSTLLQAKGRCGYIKTITAGVEDPETRLHPIMLSVAPQLLNSVTATATATTNPSGIPQRRGVCRMAGARIFPRRRSASGPGGLSAEDGSAHAFITALIARRRCLRVAGYCGRREKNLGY